MSIHNSLPWNQEFRNDTHVLGILFAGQDEDKQDDLVFLGINAHWEEQHMQLPDLAPGLDWSVQFYTNVPHVSGQDYNPLVRREGNTFWIAPRSVLILTGSRKA